MIKTIHLCLILIVATVNICIAEDFAMKRNKMVEEQIHARGINSPKVLEAMKKVPRHLFVPKQNINFAYEDHPLPIGEGQTISQPYIVAYMTEQALLKPEDKVLEIGTGSGYQAAILGELVSEVYTIEIHEPLAKSAEQRLSGLGYKNVFVKHGDGYLGWKEHAPYDSIIVTAAPPKIPENLIGQLKTGGRMIIPVGSLFQELQVIMKKENGIITESLIPVRFVPMVHQTPKN